MWDEQAEPSIATAAWADPDYYAQKHAYREGSFWLGRVPGREDQTIGYRGDRHVFLCGETRSGKGRAFIVNNIITWPGSLISIDPKGENATIAAARRGDGDDYCDGMGQDCFVLDPFETARVDDRLRGFFDPMLSFKADDPRLIDKANMLANAICIPKDGAGDSAVWLERGQRYAATIIMHVVTSPVFEGQRRGLDLVRKCIVSGMQEEARLMAADPECENVSGIEILLNDMADNEALRGTISRRGASYLESYRSNFEYFDSVRTNAENETEFLDSPGIENVVGATDRWKRTFDPASLKTSTKGVSVFLCLPQGEEEVYSRWQRLMIYALSDALISTPGKPVKGDVLISLDEFLSLSKMKRLEDGMEALAGAGGKLFIAVQKLGRLKETYGKNWETFISGAGCQIWFSPDSLEVAQYLEKLLGETEVIRIAESQNSSESTTTTNTRSEAEGSTQTHGTADQTGASESTNRSTANTRGTSRNRQSGSSFQYGTQRGTSQGTSKEPFFMFAPLRSGTQSGSNYSTNSNRGTNTSSGSGTNKSRTETVGSSQSTSSSHTVNQSYAQSRTTTQSEALAQGETTGRGSSQTFHKKPLLTVNEMNRLLPTYDDIEDDRYPGFALVRIAGEDPFVVRKCYYDQDVAFGRRFSPHPDHAFFPHNRLPMLAYQITDEHFLDIFLPNPTLLAKYDVSISRHPSLEEGQEYWADEEAPIALEIHKPEWGTLHWPMPKAGKVLSIGDGRKEPLISIRLREPITQSDVTVLRQAYWENLTAPLLETERLKTQRLNEERQRMQAILEIADLAISNAEALERAKHEAERRRVADIKSQIKDEILLYRGQIFKSLIKEITITLSITLLTALLLYTIFGNTRQSIIDIDIPGYILISAMVFMITCLFTIQEFIYQSDKYKRMISSLEEKLHRYN